MATRPGVAEPLPDLVPNPLIVNDIPQYGQSCIQRFPTVKACVSNVGAAAAGPFSISYGFVNGGTFLTDFLRVEELEAGQGLCQQVYLPNDAPLNIVVDSHDEVAESNEDNNRRYDIIGYATLPPTCSPNPLLTPTPTPTTTSSRTPTVARTPTPTRSITQTPTRSPTITRTPTKTPSFTNTPTNTRTSTPTKSTTRTAAFSVTITQTPTQTRTVTVTPTHTLMPTDTETPLSSPSATDEPTRTATITQSPTESATVTRTPTDTPTVAEALTPTSSPSETNRPIPTATPIPPLCIGDCNGDGAVTVDELVTGVEMALGTVSPGTCDAFCFTGCGPGPAYHPPDVACIIRGVRFTLEGCPASCATDEDCDPSNSCAGRECTSSGCLYGCRCR